MGSAWCTGVTTGLTASSSRRSRATDILSGLNDRQAEAVRCCDGPELVLAGAGSGKTRVLTSKIAYLIGELGLRPHRLLALTFTNKAAREMLERVKRLVGDDLHGMQVSTFHSFGLRMLHRNAASLGKFGYPNGFSVCDRSDSRALVRRAARKLSIDTKAHSDSSLLERISRAKADADPRTLEPDIDERYRPLYGEYQKLLRDSAAMDFDDLMMMPLHMLLTDRDVLARERARVDWILVDEYQDVNVPQYMMLRALAQGEGACGRVMVVGDPDQSIYGWRGADMSLIMNFEDDFPGARVVVLDQNYRSTSNILNGANAVISRNTERREKRLWTASGDGERIYELRAQNDLDESSFIADEIERLADRGYRYSEMAILYRVNSLSRGFEQKLLERGLPYHIVRGTSFYDRREVKDVVSMIRLAFNPRDVASLERIANVPARGLGTKGVETLASYLAIAEGTPDEVWRELAGAPPLKGKGGEGARELALMMRRLAECEEMSDAVCGVLDDFGYRAFLADEYPEEFEDRVDNVLEILSVVPEEGTIPEILAEISLFTDAESASGGEDGVNLLTLHAAKGLEFPIVFLVGMEEGVFPSGRAVEMPGGMEEERRLCYVGMTRARERLYMSCAASRLMFGRFTRSAASRFLSELPPEVLRLDDRTKDIASPSRGGTDRRRWRW